MIKFAVNFSEESKCLTRDKLIKPDLLKCPDWPDLVDEALKINPVYVHFDIKLGSKKFSKVDWDQVKTLMGLTQTRYVNAHLAFPKTNDLGFYKNSVNQQLAFLIREFGNENIIIENAPFGINKQPYQFPASDPEFIDELIKSHHCGFLLDISHAIRTANKLNLPPIDFIQSYPLSFIKEIHITGFKTIDGEKMDHYPMQDEDWQMFERVINIIKKKNNLPPEIIAFEYGGYGPLFDYRSEREFILSQVPKFRKIIQETFTL
jgi:uncharacterized protein (UPF0276 family)